MHSDRLDQPLLPQQELTSETPSKKLLRSFGAIGKSKTRSRIGRVGEGVPEQKGDEGSQLASTAVALWPESRAPISGLAPDLEHDFFSLAETERRVKKQLLPEPGTTIDLDRSSIEQARVRVQALNLLYLFMPATQADAIIAQTVAYLEEARLFELGVCEADVEAPAKILSLASRSSLSFETLEQLRRMPEFVEGVVAKAIKMVSSVGPKFSKFKLSALKDWWIINERYHLRIGKKPAEDARLSELADKLYRLERLPILGHGLLDEEIAIEATSRRLADTTLKPSHESLEEIHTNTFLIMRTFYPSQPGWVTSAQIAYFVAIAKAFYAVEDKAEAILASIQALSKARESADVPDFFWQWKAVDQILLVRLLKQAAFESHATSEAMLQERDFQEHLEHLLASVPAGLRKLFVRAQSALTEVSVVERQAEGEVVLLRHLALRDGSYPADLKYSNETINEQLLVNVLQAFELSLTQQAQYYCQTFADYADALASVPLSIHVPFTSLLSPVGADPICHYGKKVFGQSHDDNNLKMVAHLSKVIQFLQKVLTGQVRLEREVPEDGKIDGIGIRPETYAQLKKYEDASFVGMTLKGLRLLPSVEYNNLSINEFRRDQNFLRRRGKKAKALGLLTNLTSIAEQPLGSRAMVIGFAAHIQNILHIKAATNKSLLNFRQHAILTQVVSTLMSVTRHTDLAQLSLRKLGAVSKQLEEARAELLPHTKLKDLRLGLDALACYLQALNQQVRPNKYFNRPLLLAGYEELINHSLLGCCKSSSDRKGQQKATVAALLAIYALQDTLPRYGAPAGYFANHCSRRLRDMNALFFYFNARSLFHQFSVRDDFGRSRSMKSVEHIGHLGTLMYLDEADISLKRIKETADRLKVKPKALIKPSRELTRVIQHDTEAGMSQSYFDAVNRVRALPAKEHVRPLMDAVAMLNTGYSSIEAYLNQLSHTVREYRRTLIRELSEQDIGKLVIAIHDFAYSQPMEEIVNEKGEDLLREVFSMTLSAEDWVKILIPGQYSNGDKLPLLIDDAISDVGERYGQSLRYVLAHKGVNLPMLLSAIKWMPGYTVSAFCRVAENHAPLADKAWFCVDSQQAGAWNAIVSPNFRKVLTGLFIIEQLKAIRESSGALAKILSNSPRLLLEMMVAGGIGLLARLMTTDHRQIREISIADLAAAGLFALTYGGLRISPYFRSALRSFFAHREMGRQQSLLKGLPLDPKEQEVLRSLLDVNFGSVRAASNALTKWNAVQASATCCAKVSDRAVSSAILLQKTLQVLLLAAVSLISVLNTIAVTGDVLGENEVASNPVTTIGNDVAALLLLVTLINQCRLAWQERKETQQDAIRGSRSVLGVMPQLNCTTPVSDRCVYQFP